MSIYKRLGLPRPLAFNTDHNRWMPVPWSQETTPVGDDEIPDWGTIDTSSMNEVWTHGFCLVCGEIVEVGCVIVTREHDFAHSRTYDLDTLCSVEVVDSGPLHERCGKLTMAHCPHFKGAEPGRFYLKPYTRSHKRNKRLTKQ